MIRVVVIVEPMEKFGGEFVQSVGRGVDGKRETPMAWVTQLQGWRYSVRHVGPRSPGARAGVVLMQCLKYHQI